MSFLNATASFFNETALDNLTATGFGDVSNATSSGNDTSQVCLETIKTKNSFVSFKNFSRFDNLRKLM